MLYVAHGQAEAFAEMEHPATCLFVQCGHCGTALYTGVEMLPVFQPLLLVRRPSLSRTQTGCMRSSTMASGQWPVWSVVVLHFVSRNENEFASFGELADRM